MNEQLLEFNTELDRYLRDTDPNEIKLFSIMSFLYQHGFVEKVYAENRGKKIQVRNGQEVLGEIVTAAEGAGIMKLRVGEETTLRKPPSSEALTQAATWIFSALSKDTNVIPLITFAIVDSDTK